MTVTPRYEEPYYWWGPRWDEPGVRSIADLLRDDTFDATTAAVLWAALARRRSVVVVAGPSGVGKTTALTALLAFLPADTRRVYLRGCFESFAFADDPRIVPARTALLINEISPHLPVYLWGPAVARACELAGRGFALLATAHADSATEFVGSLSGSPLRIPPSQVAAFEFVAVLRAEPAARSGRRIAGVRQLVPTRDGVEVVDALANAHNAISQASPTPSASGTNTLFPGSELAARRQLLAGLLHEQREFLPVERFAPHLAGERPAP